MVKVHPELIPGKLGVWWEHTLAETPYTHTFSPTGNPGKRKQENPEETHRENMRN